jgi:hypothetical protein
VLLIELKQWSNPKPGKKGRLYLGRHQTPHKLRLHPSLQVTAYQQHLTDYIQAFRSAPPIKLLSCVYAHNYRQQAGPLFAPRYAPRRPLQIPPPVARSNSPT